MDAQDVAARTRADQHFAAAEWEEARTAYQRYLQTEENEKDSLALFNLSVAALRLQDFSAAATALERAASAGFPRLNVQLQRARLATARGDVRAAIDTLDVLANRGLRAYQRIAVDPDFTPLLREPAFQKVLSRLRGNAYPCLRESQYQKLDFWLGEWEVFVGGQKRAESSITKGEAGCTLLENYLTLGGYTGRSFNHFDPTDSLYKQIWVDVNNRVSHYREMDARPGYLAMESTNGPQPVRMSYEYFAEGDSVVQLLSTSPDSGQTWQNVFTGIYRRKAGSPVYNVDPRSARELLRKSVAWHDPEDRWHDLRDTVVLQEPRLGNLGRATTLVFDNPRESFSVVRTVDAQRLTYQFTGEECRILLDGTEQSSVSLGDGRAVSCPEANKYRDFYYFLQGMPMSLDDFGWEPAGIPYLVHFRGAAHWRLRISVADAPFGESWTLFFDESTAALRALSYDKADGTPGELIVLDDEMRKGGIRFPRQRRWFAADGTTYLGSDIGF